MLFFLSSLLVRASTVIPCARKMLSVNDRSSDTEQFILYLDIIVAERVLGPRELELFEKELVKNRIQNPIPNNTFNKKFSFHFREFQKLIDQGNLDRILIKKWVSGTIQKIKKQEKQKEQSKKNTKEVPVHTTLSGAQFFKIKDPILGEGYKILKPGGSYENQTDWEQRLWTTHPLRNKNGKIIEVSNRGGPSDSLAIKACRELGEGASLPTLDEYIRLLSYFEHVGKGDQIELTKVGIKKFYELFPETDEWIWTQSPVGASTEVLWSYSGPLGHLRGTPINFNNRVLCVGNRK